MPSHDQNRLSVSVIIPTYNRAAFVAQTIESCQNQTRPPEEIIVVDDGSTDNTAEVLEPFASSVTVIRQANAGPSAARNAGLRAATCDAVIFLDSDDRLTPDCIEKYATVLEDNSHIDVVYSDAYVVDSAFNQIGLSSQLRRSPCPSGMVFGEFGRGNFVTVTSIVRRASLRGTFFDEGLSCAEDYDFWRRLAVWCRFQYVEAPLLLYRQHGTQVTRERGLTMLDNRLEVQRRIIEMPEFQALPRRDRARTYCKYGVGHAARGNTRVARQMLWRAVRTVPSYPLAWALAVLSLLGGKALQYPIQKRREMRTPPYQPRHDKAVVAEA